MPYKLYDIGKLCGLGTEVNVAIVHGDRVIFSDNEAVHTVHLLSDRVTNNLTAGQILESESCGDVEDIGKWVRVFGGRIEHNYRLLLGSIREIGLDPKDFPRVW